MPNYKTPIVASDCPRTLNNAASIQVSLVSSLGNASAPKAPNSYAACDCQLDLSTVARGRAFKFGGV